jgi:phenylacetate-coenzyme A ligase PaaK-like adenylate-forming protein
LKEFIPKFKQNLFQSENFDFDELAMEAFRYQAELCPPYSEFLFNLGIKPQEVKKVNQIPFLPISLFKSREVIVDGLKAEKIFLSSGTTGTIKSQKAVPDLNFYHEITVRAFEHFFGPIEGYHFFFCLPGYGEFKNSSLLSMADHFFSSSNRSDGGFFHDDFSGLKNALIQSRGLGKKRVIFGVTHALRAFAKGEKQDFGSMIVIETGGMKGRGPELIREDVHQELQTALGPESINSEYGMAELNSQSYALEEGNFRSPPWKKVMIRDLGDPKQFLGDGRTGAINIIDLANIETCCFIATDDLGRMNEDGSFEVLGRIDQSDMRGCNLLAF